MFGEASWLDFCLLWQAEISGLPKGQSYSPPFLHPLLLLPQVLLLKGLITQQTRKKSHLNSPYLTTCHNLTPIPGRSPVWEALTLGTRKFPKKLYKQASPEPSILTLTKALTPSFVKLVYKPLLVVVQWVTHYSCAHILSVYKFFLLLICLMLVNSHAPTLTAQTQVGRGKIFAPNTQIKGISQTVKWEVLEPSALSFLSGQRSFP